jgi:hypothetical protein
MFGRLRFLLAVVAFFFLALPASAVCISSIHNATELNNIRNNLAGIYCLANDIDLSSIVNFVPIGDDETRFTGQLLGNKHAIRNLKINASAFTFSVGLFGVTDGATVQDLDLINANVTSSSEVTDSVAIGAIAGAVTNSTIARVTVSGRVTCQTGECLAGGIVGNAFGIDTLVDLRSSANVAVLGDHSSVGGVAGQNDQAKVTGVYSKGSISCRNLCFAGGVIGLMNSDGTIALAFATGPVFAGDNSSVGGLIGRNDGSVSQCFAEGLVSGGNATIVPGTLVGGLIGRQGSFQGSGKVTESYSVGHVRGGTGASVGGLIGSTFGSPTITTSYWDTSTSGRSASAGGIGRTTSQLRAALPSGFTSVWSITSTFSYPFFASAIKFASPLATMVVQNRVFVFLPISQLERSEYITTPAHARLASLATVYTMMARTIGITDNVHDLRDVKIDRYFWHDSTETTTFAGPITQHASLGTFQNIASTQPLDDTNVIGALKTRKLVAILRGQFSGGTHFMLATLFTLDTHGVVTAVVANDPWTGKQVRIDPRTKHVVSPGFPLTDFTVNGFQTVTIN